MQKPQQSRKRDSAAGTPFHHPQRGSSPWAPLAPSPHLASSSRGRWQGHLETGLPRGPGAGTGKPGRRAPPASLSPAFLIPNGRSDRTCAPRPGSAPARPRGGEASRARPASSRPSGDWRGPRAAPAPTALTVRPRRSGRAAGQAEHQQERQQAARRAARAPGPPAHAAAAAYLPARPRLLLRPQGAEIRRRALRGGGRPGRFRRRAGKRRTPRGSPGGGGAGPVLQADAHSFTSSFTHLCTCQARGGHWGRTAGRQGPALLVLTIRKGNSRPADNDTNEQRVLDCARRKRPSCPKRVEPMRDPSLSGAQEGTRGVAKEEVKKLG